MRLSCMNTIRIIFILSVLIIGCGDGRLSNPTSPSVDPTEWRSGTATEAGETFYFPDIGITIEFPAGAIPQGEIFPFEIRGFPPDIPLLPTGPVLVRLGTIQIRHVRDEPMTFDFLVDVRFPIAEEKDPGIVCRGYILNEIFLWEDAGNSPVISDGGHAIMSIGGPGIYGAFETVPLYVEATVSRQQGPVPLSVGFKAIVTGGHPPYSLVWDFGDNDDPQAGVSVAHLYENPGDYTATVLVVDDAGIWVSDWIHLTAYWIAGPPAIP